MVQHRRFHYKSIEELLGEIGELGVQIPITQSLESLQNHLMIGDKRIPNRLAVQPMEGCDGTREGKPDHLTFRRYERFARGGAGLIWFEAAAVVPEGRANPRQLYINKDNLGEFVKLHNNTIAAAQDEFGSDFRPYTVVQLTHSGRYSKPEGKMKPVIPQHNPYLDKNLTDDYPLITDDELEELEEKYVAAALLAREAGFDGVDIKACHGYLLGELLSCYNGREGKYGGSFENRIRFIKNVVKRIKDLCKDSLEVTLRLNAYDAIPYPYGWGVHKEDYHLPDAREPISLLKELGLLGVKLANISCGNPYYNPHVTRPYNQGGYIPPEHPLEAVSRILGITRGIQGSLPHMAIMASGFSWLREFAPFVAAAGIKDGWFSLAGFGRLAIAYPRFTRDIIDFHRLNTSKCCTACSCCTVMMRDGGTTGCLVRDTQVYGPVYEAGRQGKSSAMGTRVAEHI